MENKMTERGRGREGGREREGMENEMTERGGREREGMENKMRERREREGGNGK